MPAISVMATLTGALSPATVYTKLFTPAIPPDSLEILNGGMDTTNYTGGDNSIPMWAVQYGTWACGFYTGFDTWEYTYAQQLVSEDVSPSERIRRNVHARLSYSFFMPWTASLLIVGYQAFFQQDATLWDSDNDEGAAGTQAAYWDIKCHLGGSALSEWLVKLPATRSSVGLADANNPGADGWVDPLFSIENRWRFLSKMHMVQPLDSNLSVGNHRLDLSTWMRVYANDSKQAKCKTACGGAWALALR